MKPDFTALLHRLDQVYPHRDQASAEMIEVFTELREGIQQAIDISERDPEMSLTRMRKLLECVIVEVYERRLGSKAKKPELVNMIHDLEREGILPSKEAAYAHAVRGLGNVGAHAHVRRRGRARITQQDVEHVLGSLLPVLEWYFEAARPHVADGALVGTQTHSSTESNGYAASRKQGEERRKHQAETLSAAKEAATSMRAETERQGQNAETRRSEEEARKQAAAILGVRAVQPDVHSPDQREADLADRQQETRLVTNRQYLAFVRDAGSRAPAHWNGSLPPPQEIDSPVTNISWNDALAYCDWNGGRLPPGNPELTHAAQVSVSDERLGLAAWQNAGTEHLKQVCAISEPRWLAIMNRTISGSNVGFQCLPPRPLAMNRWIHFEGGQFDLGTDVRLFSHLATVFQLPRHLAQAILNRTLARHVVSKFTISANCVTNEEYYAFTEASGNRWPSYWDSVWLRRTSRPFPVRTASQPVTNISAEEARAYCAGSGCRLPAWYEWECAASGGMRNPYPWGCTYKSIFCNSSETGLGTLADVDEFPTGDTSEGLRQLCGNVAEWVIGPRGYEVRGGSYLNRCEIWGLVYAFRERPPTFRAIDVGFRIVTDRVK